MVSQLLEIMQNLPFMLLLCTKSRASIYQHCTSKKQFTQNFISSRSTMVISEKILLILVLAIAFMTKSAKAQLPDCYFQQVNLAPCLTGGVTGTTSEVCCQALNQAVSSGQQCLCSIIVSTNLFLNLRDPLPTSPQGIELPGCRLLLPSLSACQEVPGLTMIPPPATIDMNSTVGTVPTPETSNPVPNGTTDGQQAPVREGQEPLTSIPQSGTTDQAGASSSRRIQIINYVLCIACTLLVINLEAFFSFK